MVATIHDEMCDTPQQVNREVRSMTLVSNFQFVLSFRNTVTPV